MISRVFGIAVAGLLLAACVQQEEPDFCKNHALFHAEHADRSAELEVTIAEGGQVSAGLSLPGANAVAADLSDAARVFTLETAEPCTIDSAGRSAEQGRQRWAYSAECGADNKLGQLNVLLFDALPDLDEVLVHVTTPVTEKHFAIHRQCSSAIFRLQ